MPPNALGTISTLTRRNLIQSARLGVRSSPRMRYDGDIMRSRTQITLEPELQRQARKRASDMGVSFAEYVRRLVARDLGSARPGSNPAAVFDLGASGGSDVTLNKDAMIAAAFANRARGFAGR